MSYDRKLPMEIVRFESFLKKPDSDPTGFAGFFNSGEILVTRVPARLDIMGSISDYSGSNVCESVLGRGMVITLQPRTGYCALEIRDGRRFDFGVPRHYVKSVTEFAMA